jgi:hypothetical protein
MTPNNESIGGDDDSAPSPYSPDDLIELVRAIKFAHTDMSTRNVHHEISVTMADSDPTYAFLKDVRLNDVKKVWKKALRGSPETKDSTTSPVMVNGEATPRPEKDAAAKPQAVAADGTTPPDGIVKFYTVGDGSVKTLAENYSHHHAEAAVAREGRQQHEGGGETEREGGGGYTHFFLDVPADLSGSRPHQALMNYQDNGKAGKARGKSGSRKKSAAQQPCDDDDRDIFKIQLAAALPLGMEDVPTPMLLYNSDRSAKTFIHPPSSSSDDADDRGYSRIRNMIADSGTSGALGATGGQKVSAIFVSIPSVFVVKEIPTSKTCYAPRSVDRKAYFYGFVTKTKSGPDVISVQTTELAPSQAW